MNGLRSTSKKQPRSRIVSSKAPRSHLIKRSMKRPIHRGRREVIHSESFEESSSVQGEDEDYKESDDEAVPQKGKKVMISKVE